MPDRETELMLRVKGGDRAAFEELYELYKAPLGNFLYRLCGNRSLTEDLLQDTFLRLWRAAPGYEPLAKVSTYVFRIAHNLFVNDASRRREATLGEADSETSSGPTEDLHRQEVQAAVKRAVERLPEGERECLVLSEYNGFKYQQISEILGIPVGTVKSRMFSALRHLKEALDGFGRG